MYNKRKPDLFEPKPVKPTSILGKRKLDVAFGKEVYYDKERYGQDIPQNFFKNNIGHGV